MRNIEKSPTGVPLKSGGVHEGMSGGIGKQSTGVPLPKGGMDFVRHNVPDQPTIGPRNA